MWTSRQTLALVAVVLLASVAAGGAVTAGAGAASADAESEVCAGRIADRPEGLTVVSVQGMRFDENESLQGKRPARVVAFHPDGSVAWVHRNGKQLDVSWSYDVDPMENGNVFVTATVRGGTLVYELDGETGDVVWRERVPGHDTHDADLLPNGNVVVANMRNYDENDSVNRDRVYVYDRTTDEVVWEWEFENYFDRGVGGNYTNDWTHVNDVDVVGEHRLLLSPRNFDQVVMLNRTSGEVVWRLGRYGERSTLAKQHNPDYLVGENGTETVLVADSENDRIVEYARDGDGWTRTWTLRGPEGTLDWPRDADRLPNGNTLVGDSINDRVVEVTPSGEVVWEVYAPWLVYDAARLDAGEHGNRTIGEQNATGTYALTNGSVASDGDIERCAERIAEFENEQWANETTDGPSSTGSSSSTDDADTSARTDPGGAGNRLGGGETTVTPVGFTAALALVAIVSVWWWRR